MTAILAGYLIVWLPQPAAGLSFLGFELGEWIKFIPAVREGALVPGRLSFFLPPICLALMVILWSATWPSARWQTWVIRLLAVGIAGLAIPPLEVIRFESGDQWLVRVAMIGLVAATAAISPLWPRIPEKAQPGLWGWSLMILASVGGLLPTWAYFSLRPLVSEVLGVPVGTGPGVILNLLGNVVVAVSGAWQLLIASND